MEEKLQHEGGGEEPEDDEGAEEELVVNYEDVMGDVPKLPNITTLEIEVSAYRGHVYGACVANFLAWCDTLPLIPEISTSRRCSRRMSLLLQLLWPWHTHPGSMHMKVKLLISLD